MFRSIKSPIFTKDQSKSLNLVEERFTTQDTALNY